MGKKAQNDYHQQQKTHISSSLPDQNACLSSDGTTQSPMLNTASLFAEKWGTQLEKCLCKLIYMSKNGDKMKMPFIRINSFSAIAVSFICQEI